MTSQTFEQPSQPVIQQFRPQSADLNVISRRTSRAEGPRSLFLLITFPLGFSSWIISLVSQAIFAATINNASVRQLWFGIVIQFILLVEVFEVLISGNMFAYAVQISVFAGLVTVFAVLGVDQFIYGSSALDKSIGVGWLITALVDLLWIVYFTSPPDSHLIRLPSTFASYGQFSGRDRTEPVERNQDPFILAPPNGSGDAKLGAEVLKDGSGSDANDLDNMAALDIDRVKEERMRGPERTSGYDLDDDVHRRGSRTKSGITSMYASTAPRSSAVMDEVHGVGREGSALGSERARSRPPSVGPEAPPEQPHLKATPSKSSRKAPQRLKPVIPDAQPDAQWRAEAMFDYSGSADAEGGGELSFKKGEHLEIIDRSGKWWEARAADGRTGIVPSNYLHLL